MIALTKKRITTVKRAIYTLFLLVVVAWLIVGCLHLMRVIVSGTATNNNAQLLEFHGDALNLPRPTSISTGKTSSNLASVTTRYANFAESLEQKKLHTPPFFIQFSGANVVRKHNSTAKQNIDSLRAGVTTTDDALSTLQKFIEYDPATDLQNYANGTEADKETTERLRRTHDGLEFIVKTTNDKQWPFKQDVLTIISPFVVQSNRLTPMNLTDWEKNVHSAQYAIIRLIDAYYASHVLKAADSLPGIARRYLPDTAL